MPTALQVAAFTTVGTGREHNDDTFLVADLETGTSGRPDPARTRLESAVGFALGVFSAAGGFRWGRPGAEIAAEVVRAELLGAPHAAALAGAMREASRAIADEVGRDRRRIGLSVVATVALIEGHSLHLAHVGDARAYLLRGGQVTQLTRDDSMVNDGEALGYPQQQRIEGVVTRALGYGTTADHVGPKNLVLEAGDILVLCTGLNGTPGALEAIAGARDPMSAVEKVRRAVDDLRQTVQRATGPNNVAFTKNVAVVAAQCTEVSAAATLTSTLEQPK